MLDQHPVFIRYSSRQDWSVVRLSDLIARARPAGNARSPARATPRPQLSNQAGIDSTRRRRGHPFPRDPYSVHVAEPKDSVHGRNGLLVSARIRGE